MVLEASFIEPNHLGRQGTSRVPTRILLKLNFTKALMERFFQATLIEFKISILCINEVNNWASCNVMAK